MNRKTRDAEGAQRKPFTFALALLVGALAAQVEIKRDGPWTS